MAQPGKGLAQVLAERLVRVSAKWEVKLTARGTSEDEKAFYQSALGSAAQLLCTVCTHYINEPDRSKVVSKEIQMKLGPILVVWAARYMGEFLGDVSARLVAFMTASVVDDAFNQVRRASKNWQVCGLPSCSVKKDLKVCARCQTVRYCKTEHQRADWKIHKMYCFTTEY
ncbi:hypothetical protein FB45DRAFT_888251 [Roridomyces roridus]|uniref:MYND-type domain-containing protein n=1 Tax=Roridomyces roridus TaxID=1738132 RepID=A0AAD7CJZ9_9AGAR|nr:hypothetical protein FB45DRAFT_888251 [Roridomyces roridus]